MLARIFFFPFLYKFVDNPKGPFERKKDPTLKDKFLHGPYKNELFTLLMYNAHGLCKRRKLNPSKFLKKKLKEYVSEIDNVKEYLQKWKSIENPRCRIQSCTWSVWEFRNLCDCVTCYIPLLSRKSFEQTTKTTNECS